jgi:hypothetical protein
MDRLRASDRSLPSPGSSRADRNSVARNHSGRKFQARNSEAQSLGNPGRPLEKAAKIARSRGRSLMVLENRRPMHGVGRASPMLRKPVDSSLAVRSRGRRSPAMENFRLAHVRLARRVTVRSRGSAIAPKQARDPRAENRLASPADFNDLADSSRLALLAPDSSQPGPDRRRQGPPIPNRDRKEPSPGHRKALVPGLAAQNPMSHGLRANLTPRREGPSRGRNGRLRPVVKAWHRNDANEKSGKKDRDHPRHGRRVAASPSGRRIRAVAKARPQPAVAIVRMARKSRERAARRNDRSLPRNGRDGTATSAPRHRH